MKATISTYKGRESQWVEARVLINRDGGYSIPFRASEYHTNRSKAISRCRVWVRENGYTLVSRRELDE